MRPWICLHNLHAAFLWFRTADKKYYISLAPAILIALQLKPVFRLWLKKKYNDEMRNDEDTRLLLVSRTNHKGTHNLIIRFTTLRTWVRLLRIPWTFPSSSRGQFVVAACNVWGAVGTHERTTVVRKFMFVNSVRYFVGWRRHRQQEKFVVKQRHLFIVFLFSVWSIW